MAELIIIEGESGVGKSHSLINMPSEKTLILANSDKKVPFAGANKWLKRTKVVDDMTKLPDLLRKCDAAKIPYVVVEDHTHFQNARILSEGFKVAGQSSQNKYTRWETFGRDVYSSIFGIAKELKNIQYIVVMAHVSKDADGMYSFKTFGKMVGNTVDPVSYARIVLHGVVDPDKKKPEEKHLFITNHDGIHEAKSPAGMFPPTIPNDLLAVIEAVDKYDQAE